MKILFFLALLFSLCSYAQGRVKSDVALYEEAMSFEESTYENTLFFERISKDTVVAKAANLIVMDLLKQALYNYTEIIKKYPDSKLYHDALYQKGLMEFYVGHTNEAKDTFKAILNTDMEAYKMDALYNLTAIAIDQKEYELGLQYLDESKKHKKVYMCGVVREKDTLKFKRMYDQCFVALQQKE